VSGESLTLQNVQANTPVYVWVDGTVANNAAAFGNYALIVTP
jgi:hypothetical protein